jgi:hypothetical protein
MLSGMGACLPQVTPLIVGSFVSPAVQSCYEPAPPADRAAFRVIRSPTRGGKPHDRRGGGPGTGGQGCRRRCGSSAFPQLPGRSLERLVPDARGDPGHRMCRRSGMKPIRRMVFTAFAATAIALGTGVGVAAADGSSPAPSPSASSSSSAPGQYPGYPSESPSASPSESTSESPGGPMEGHEGHECCCCCYHHKHPGRHQGDQGDQGQQGDQNYPSASPSAGM